jgi:predicted dehydrogenase
VHNLWRSGEDRRQRTLVPSRHARTLKRLNRGEVNRQQIDELGTGEAEHFADCIRNHRDPESPGEEGLKDMLVIEAIYKAVGAPIA